MKSWVRWLILFLFAVYFFGPMVSTFIESTKYPGHPSSLKAWSALVTNNEVLTAIGQSLLLCLTTVVLMLVLLLPTMIWVRLRLPKLSRIIEFLCLLPLTIPALVIVVGINGVYAWVNFFFGYSPWVLTFAYVVLVLPYSYRSLDSALSALDVTTLAEAARSLGAGWLTVIARVIVPNLGAGILSAAFISVALVLGEYTFASLLNYQTLPVVIALFGKSNANVSDAASLATIIFAAALLLLLSFVGHRSRGRKGA
jgi:putative spermidine/putrescine transport system permease protein